MVFFARCLGNGPPNGEEPLLLQFACMRHISSSIFARQMSRGDMWMQNAFDYLNFEHFGAIASFGWLSPFLERVESGFWGQERITSLTSAQTVKNSHFSALSAGCVCIRMSEEESCVAVMKFRPAGIQFGRRKSTKKRWIIDYCIRRVHTHVVTV